MLIWILKRTGMPESRMIEILERITGIKTVVSAVFYTLMVFIVIFGISGDVYAGFPKIAPYIIIAVFLFMAFVRMYQCMVDEGYVSRTVAKRLDDLEKKRLKKAEKAANSSRKSQSSEETAKE